MGGWRAGLKFKVQSSRFKVQSRSFGTKFNPEVSGQSSIPKFRDKVQSRSFGTRFNPEVSGQSSIPKFRDKVQSRSFGTKFNPEVSGQSLKFKEQRFGGFCDSDADYSVSSEYLVPKASCGFSLYHSTLRLKIGD